MAMLLEFLKKYRYPLMVGGVLLATFVVYSLNLRHKEKANAVERMIMSVTAPVCDGITGVTRLMDRVWTDYVALVDVRTENRKLRDTISVLNRRVMDANEAVVANERLKKLLDLKTVMRIPSVTATIIGEDGAPWFKTVLIDRGSADGLQEGMPVVAVDGVAGLVVKVSSASARVQLLTDHASGIAGVIQRSRARGVVKGMGRGKCRLEFTLKEDDVKIGDTVVTSGIGGIFPKGLPVGEITMVRKGEYGIFQTIEIRPAVNLSRLEEVLVLMTRNP
jgi:rod shape-determining protein MreC